ncbi:hypothetical protein I601_2877 [Nocardioides dokdonensis FR1436]|uniref:SnoaL-like domain-containing protein n=1 Tax=Nocardioides dokdonensis FR1436 TaxID=1300347 RepID=A0A1A9GNW6_9ACTN|nr:hypothetical protein [Nocardioides dokdonensis]ANH39293.1 hypothetical protein I601_2877 [Nocardioides dokdonensis FR1436]
MAVVPVSRAAPVAVVLVLLVLLVLVPQGVAGPVAAAVPDLAAPGAQEQRARTVLARWDTRRGRAWERGDRLALGALYADRSRAGRRDLRMLDAWLDRGLRVRGMQVHVLALDVLAARRHRLRLRVTDRLADAVAVGSGVRRVLPEDRPTTRSLVLTRRDGAWVVESVRLAW